MDKNWVEECLMLNSIGKSKDAKSLMRQNLPPVLYKYRPLNDYTLESLENKNLYMCNHEDLNDPYEFHPKVNIDLEFQKTISMSEFAEYITEEEYREIENNTHNRFETFNNIIEKKNINLKIDKENFEASYYEGFYSEYYSKTKPIFRICSLTERNDSTIMWSHYSSQHQGICVEYPTAGFNLDEPILPVKYDNLLCDLGEYDSSDKKMYKMNLFNILRIKAKDWKYEEEWRILYLKINETNQNESIFLNTPKPTAIYLGSKFSENSSYKRSLLIKIAEKDNIPLYHMKLDYNQFRMIPIK